MEHLGKQNIELNVGSEHMMGSQAYVKIFNELMARMLKLASCVWIGYMRGAEETNIYGVWISPKQEVLSVRDVIIDETVCYDPSQPFLKDSLATTSPEPPSTMDSTMLGVDEPNARCQALDEMMKGPVHQLLCEVSQGMGLSSELKAKPDITSTFLPTPDATLEPIWGGEGGEKGIDDDVSNQLHQELSEGSELPHSGSNEAVEWPPVAPDFETSGLPGTFDNDDQLSEETEPEPLAQPLELPAPQPGYSYDPPTPSREIISEITTDNTISGKRI